MFQLCLRMCVSWPQMVFVSVRGSIETTVMTLSEEGFYQKKLRLRELDKGGGVGVSPPNPAGDGTVQKPTRTT